jgi:hypothetical protein
VTVIGDRESSGPSVGSWFLTALPHPSRRLLIVQEKIVCNPVNQVVHGRAADASTTGSIGANNRGGNEDESVLE